MTTLEEQITGSRIEALSPTKHAYLVVDCGHTNTTAVLFDIVEGVYRFIAYGTAPTTAGAPWFDAIRGVQGAIAQIIRVTGRRLLTDQGALVRPSREDGSGIDHFGILLSAAEPINAFVIGLLDDVSLASARRALDTIYARELDAFSLADKRTQQEQVDALLKSRPDLIFIAGGTDGGSDPRLMKSVETVALSLEVLDSGSRPVVVYAGNNRLRAKVKESLGGLTRFHVADNVRPSLETESLDGAITLLGEIYEAHQMAAVPGAEELFSWSTFPPLPTVHGLAGIMGYFAALYQGRVMGLDVGSDALTFISADPESIRVSVRSDLGSGRLMANALNRVSPKEIIRWSIPPLNPARLRDFLLDRSLWPASISLTEEDLHIEQAVLRQIIRRAVVDAGANWDWSSADGLPPFKLLLLRGRALTNTPRAGQTVLMILDALQPKGIFALAVDRHGILPALGLLSPHNPRLVVQSLEGGVLDDLGWVIAPVGRARPGQVALNVRMESEATGTLQIEVAYGTLEVLPLAPGHEAELKLRPTRRFDVGFGPGKGRKIRVHGGDVGLVIDARGRPLQLPDDETERRNLARQWLWDLGG